MALGLPGMSIGSPFFISGEPRREYQFAFLLTPAVSLNDIAKLSFSSFSDFFSSLSLTYISGLAEQVNLPPSKFTVGNVSIGTLQDFPYPKGFNTPTFSVVFLEDEVESVYKFHLAWQNRIRNVFTKFLSDSTLRSIANPSQENGSGLQFEPLGKACCKAIYAPTKKVSFTFMGNLEQGVGLEIPVGADVFPYVFPSEVQRSPGNKGGSNVSKTTVVYTRVPDISNWNFVKKYVSDVEVHNVQWYALEQFKR